MSICKNLYQRYQKYSIKKEINRCLYFENDSKREKIFERVLETDSKAELLEHFANPSINSAGAYNRRFLLSLLTGNQFSLSEELRIEIGKAILNAATIEEYGEMITKTRPTNNYVSAVFAIPDLAVSRPSNLVNLSNLDAKTITKILSFKEHNRMDVAIKTYFDVLLNEKNANLNSLFEIILGDIDSSFLERLAIIFKEKCPKDFFTNNENRKKLADKVNLFTSSIECLWHQTSDKEGLIKRLEILSELSSLANLTPSQFFIDAQNFIESHRVVC